MLNNGMIEDTPRANSANRIYQIREAALIRLTAEMSELVLLPSSEVDNELLFKKADKVRYIASKPVAELWETVEQPEKPPFIFAGVHEDGEIPVIHLTEDGETLFLATTAGQAVAEMLVRGIRVYSTSSSMSFSDEEGWHCKSAQIEIEAHFKRLEEMAQEVGIYDRRDCGDMFDFIEVLVLEGAPQGWLAELIVAILNGWQPIEVLNSI